MSITLKKDELNVIEPEQYFSEIDWLTDEQRKRRIAEAKDYRDMMLLWFAQYEIDGNGDYLSLADSFRERMSAYGEVDSELSDYADIFALSVAQTTMDNEGEYWTSYRRATNIGNDTAQTVENNLDFKAAMAGKKRKTWIDVRDKRERETHLEVGGSTIPVGEYFRVGKAKMRYPKDVLAADEYPEEVVNCRCGIKYHS